MKPSSDRVVRLRRALLLALGAIAFTAPGAWSQDLVAVLSSRLAPYQEALAGFEAALGRDVPVLELPQADASLTGATRVIVTFGGKAALQPFPKDAALVYCLAPGIELDRTLRRAATVKVWMLPRPADLLASLVRIQPGLTRLAVLWAAEGNQVYLRELEAVAQRGGVRIVSIKIEDANDMPQHLRAIQGRIDAIWLPPDPLLVTAQVFAVLKEFSWSNDVPLYAPNHGLVEKGATASVAVSFRDIGKAAARAAQILLAGGALPPDLFPEQSEITINLTAANACGLHLRPEAMRLADKVLP